MAIMFLCSACLSSSKVAPPAEKITKATRCTACHTAADCVRLDSAAARLQAPRPPGPELPRADYSESLEFPNAKVAAMTKPLRAPPTKKKDEKTIGPALLTAAHFAAKSRDAQRANFSRITDEILRSALEAASRGASSYVLSGDEYAVCSDEVKDELLRRKFSFAEDSQAGSTTITIMW